MPGVKEVELPNLRPMVSRMRGGETLNCAVGEVDLQTADIALHPIKQPQALGNELKRTYSKMRKAAHGVAFVPEHSDREVHLRLGVTPASKIARRLVRRLKGTGIRKIVIFTGDSIDPWESEESLDQDTDMPASPAETEQAGASGALKERLRDFGARIGSMAPGEHRKQANALLVKAIEALNRGDEIKATASVAALNALWPSGATTAASAALANHRAAPPVAANDPGDVESETLRGYLDRVGADVRAARSSIVSGPDKERFDTAYGQMVREIQSGQVEAARETATVVRGAAFKVVSADSRLTQQSSDWEAMRPVLQKVEKSYFTERAAKAMLKADLKPGKEFKGFLVAYATNSKAHTIEGCDRVEAAAQTYLDHLANDKAREKNFSSGDLARQEKKKKNAEEGIVAARHMKMALQMDEMGPPPWQGADALRATGIRASFDIETTHDNAAWKTSELGDGEEGPVDDPWPELRRSGRKPAGMLKIENIANVNATFWVDGGDPESAMGEGHRFVFKPRQGEEDLENYGFPKRGGAAREVLTQKLADTLRSVTGIDFGVPETSIAAVDPRVLDLQTFNDAMRLKGEDGAERVIATNKPVIGSVQRFEPSRGALGEHEDLLDSFSPEECQKAAILDIVAMNTDRHKNNFLVGEKPSAVGDGTVPTLLPIDHGLTLPDRNGLERRVTAMMNHPRQNILLSMAGSYDPFTTDMIERIDCIDPDAVRQSVLDARSTVDAAAPGTGAGVKISDECAVIAGRAARFLKQASRSLSPAQVQIALASKHSELFADCEDGAFVARAQAVIDAMVGKSHLVRTLMRHPHFIEGNPDIRARAKELMGVLSRDMDESRAALLDQPEKALAAFEQAERDVAAEAARRAAQLRAEDAARSQGSGEAERKVA